MNKLRRIFLCLQLATDDSPQKKPKTLSTFLNFVEQFGKGINITKKDIQPLLDKTLREILEEYLNEN